MMSETKRLAPITIVESENLERLKAGKMATRSNISRPM
jgi:hypothetical protein